MVNVTLEQSGFLQHQQVCSIHRTRYLVHKRQRFSQATDKPSSALIPILTKIVAYSGSDVLYASAKVVSDNGQTKSINPGSEGLTTQYHRCIFSKHRTCFTQLGTNIYELCCSTGRMLRVLLATFQTVALSCKINSLMEVLVLLNTPLSRHQYHV